MGAIGMGLTWFGYSVGLYGYCLVRGYAVSYADLSWPGRAVSWPPPASPDSPNSIDPQAVPTEQYVGPLGAIGSGINAIASAIGGLVSAIGGAISDPGGAANGALNGLSGALAGVLPNVPGLPDNPPTQNPQRSPTVTPSGSAGVGVGKTTPPPKKSGGVVLPGGGSVTFPNGWTVNNPNYVQGSSWTITKQ